MKIIFLDVDGELTYSDYDNPETEDIDIEKVKLLKQICDETNAKVVISSSWRGTKDWTPRFYYTLIDILKDNNIEVLGDLPYIAPEIIKDDSVSDLVALSVVEALDIKMKYGTGRAAEVKQWLSEHKIDNFVILDDEDWQWSDYGYENNWIRPTWFGDGGLKQEHVEDAIRILKGE